MKKMKLCSYFYIYISYINIKIIQGQMFLRSRKINGDDTSDNNVNKNKNKNNKNNENVQNKNTNKKITCRGCIEKQENQLAHMDYGGCLEEHELDLSPRPVIKIKRLEYEY